MNANENETVSLPAIILFGFAFLTHLATFFYAAHEAVLPEVFVFLHPFATLWIICWWFEEDNVRTGTTWPIDLGMLLYAVSIIFVPYHLIKTRGLKGVLTVLAFIGIYFAAWIAAVVILSVWPTT